jgi:agmatinase
VADFDPNAAAGKDSGVFGLPHTPENARVVLLPVPFEATTSYGGGTSAGPAAILSASRQVDLFDLEMGRPYDAGIAWLEAHEEVAGWSEQGKRLAAEVIAAGGPSNDRLLAMCGQVDRICESMNQAVREDVAHWIGQGKLVGTIGGDHSVAFGAIAATAARHPGVGILHLDAHGDLRHGFEGFTWSHASIMDNVMTRLPEVGRLVQVAIRDLCEEEHQRVQSSSGRIVIHPDLELADEQLQGTPFSQVAERIVAALPTEVYLSFDIDGLDPTLCPHTGTPVPGGLSFQQVSFLLKTVARSGRRIVGFDLTEVAPGSDGGEWDANVGARLLYKMIGWTLASHHQAEADGALGRAYSISNE